MANQAKVEYPIIRVGTEIDFLHNKQKTTAVHPFYGPNTAKNIRDAIRADSLREPTAPQTISFLDSLYGGEHPISKQTTGLMCTNYFRGFTGIVYDSVNDLISCVDFPEFNANDSINRNDLLARIAQGEVGIRTAPLSKAQSGIQTPSQLSKNLFVQALLGEEGADKSAGLTSRHPAKEAYVWLPQVGDKPEVRIAALYSDYGVLRLGVDGYYGGLSGGGYSFGVLDSSKTNKI